MNSKHFQNYAEKAGTFYIAFVKIAPKGRGSAGNIERKPTESVWDTMIRKYYTQ